MSIVLFICADQERIYQTHISYKNIQELKREADRPFREGALAAVLELAPQAREVARGSLGYLCGCGARDLALFEE
jgi:hypothetical protein